MALSLVNHGQGLEAQKVHFQQPQILNRILRKLGGQHTVLSRQGNEFLERSVGNDDTRCVGSHVPHHTLDDPTGIDDLLGNRVTLILGPEFRTFFQSFLE